MALAAGIPFGYGLLTLFVFGGAAFVCMMVAEDKKVLKTWHRIEETGWITYLQEKEKNARLTLVSPSPDPP